MFPAFSVRTTVCLALVVWMGAGQLRADETSEHAYPDPHRFEGAIRAFEKQDKLQPPPTGAIVCTGSSSLRMWHGLIHEDLKPLTVIARGFGGSTMYDLLHYCDRVIIRYQPRAVVIYEGDNDTAAKISPEKIRDTFIKLTDKIHESLPKTRIYFLAVKPSGARETLWPVAKRTNQLIAAVCAHDKRMTYVDVASPMFDSTGKLRPDIFIKDRLHMNRQGYEIWRRVLRPILLERELKCEQPNTTADANSPE